MAPSGVLVITPTRGLVDAQTRIGLNDLREEFAEVDVDLTDPALSQTTGARRPATRQGNCHEGQKY